MKKTKEKIELNTRKLIALVDGSRFRVPSLVDSLRKLTLISGNDSAVLVTGEKRDRLDEDWKPFRLHFAASTQVIPGWGDESFPSEQPDEKPKLRKKAKEVKEKAVGAKRGRKSAKMNLKFPIGEFTIGEVVLLNKVKDYVVRNEMTRLRKSGKIKETALLSGEGRGRKRTVWKLVA